MERGGVAGELQRLRIERLRAQDAVADEEQHAVRVMRFVGARDQPLVRFSVDAAGADGVLRSLVSVGRREEQEMPAIG